MKSVTLAKAGDRCVMTAVRNHGGSMNIESVMTDVLFVLQTITSAKIHSLDICL